MKYFYVLLFLLFTLSIQAQNARKVKILGSVYFQNLYCGGIQPNLEQVKKAETKFAFANSTFKLVNNTDSTKVFYLKSNSEGIITAKIPRGNYRFFMTNEYDKLLKINFKPSCTKWLNSSFGMVEISKKKRNDLELIFKFGCNPCEPPRQ